MYADLAALAARDGLVRVVAKDGSVWWVKPDVAASVKDFVAPATLKAAASKGA